MDELREKGGRTPGDALRLLRGEESVAGEIWSDLLCTLDNKDDRKRKRILED